MAEQRRREIMQLEIAEVRDLVVSLFGRNLRGIREPERKKGLEFRGKFKKPIAKSRRSWLKESSTKNLEIW